MHPQKSRGGPGTGSVFWSSRNALSGPWLKQRSASHRKVHTDQRPWADQANEIQGQYLSTAFLVAAGVSRTERASRMHESARCRTADLLKLGSQEWGQTAGMYHSIQAERTR